VVRVKELIKAEEVVKTLVEQVKGEEGKGN